jgi:hypothetical protein
MLALQKYLVENLGFQLYDNESNSFFVCMNYHLQVNVNKSLEQFNIYASSKNDSTVQKKIDDKVEELRKTIVNDPMKVMCLTIEWYKETYNNVTVDGFTDDEKLEEEPEQDFPILAHRENRPLIIYVWGKKKRDRVACKLDHNFNASRLHGRKGGVDWRKDGRDEEIRIAVRKSKGYYKFITNMVTTIEKKNCIVIGVNCAAGRHRSVTCALDLRHNYYPQADVVFLELS